MHVVYAGTRKAAWLFILVPVLVCILRISSVMALASVLSETDMQAGVGVSTGSNASANGKTAGIATMSDAEDDSAESEEILEGNLRGSAEETSKADSEETEWDLDEEPLLDDLSPIASVSNAEFQEALYPSQISVVVPTQLLIVVNPDGGCLAVGGSLENQGESAVLLTSVTFAWQTEDERDADDIFTEWARKKPRVWLTLGDDLSCVFEAEQAENDGMTWEFEAEQVILEPGENLELNWEFELNGNGLDRSLDTEEEAVVATVTYMVRSLETS